MTVYPTIVLVKYLVGTYKQWMVYEDCQAGDLLIPEGFVTDFASVPRWLWSIIPPYGIAANASVLHDYRYIFCELGQELGSHHARIRADKLFLGDLLQDGIPKWQAWAMYRAVRLFGKGHWMVNWRRIQRIKEASPIVND